MTNFIVYDLETTGKYAETAEPIEIAAKIYNSRSLEPIPGAIFSEFCKPKGKVDPEVWDITKIDPKNVETAPSIEVVFPKFIDFVSQYNPEKNIWTAPIACGHNIRKYDNVIINRMLEAYGKKKKDTVMFSPMRDIDLMEVASLWFDNTKDLENYKLDTIRRFMGLSTDGAHRALRDVEDCGQIIMKFIKFHRQLSEHYLPNIKDCFKRKKEIEV